MSKHAKYTPKHRQQPARPALGEAPKKALRTTLVLSSVAAGATGIAVGGGVVSSPVEVSAAAGALDSLERPDPGAPEVGSAATLELPEREESVSRSDRRDEADPLKEAALAQPEGQAITRTETLSDDDPRDIGRALLAEFGFSSDQWSCLDSLWTRESNWTVTADNPTSSAYGIPQALPGSKMASAGADWATNPVTQIRWGLGYIADRYGSPCSAWGHSQSVGWY
ncbi:lytic transglycosylase domain-containing protein [Nocardioides ferulae]|uniref:aggregation-promoting factor C-terminal-like domain-containing protein n=1 Tax=Nocardioides ferulae TaxID=2340821 RepID=UPI000EAFA0FF|nr:lytic transglycosylase domain-containing protein [Nocardioides ferulae]